MRVLSDLGRRDIATNVFSRLNLETASEMQKESFYRNAAGLLHPRGNVFVILLAGRTNIGIEQRALAIVWRDPVKDPDDRHPCFIRWFTWTRK